MKIKPHRVMLYIFLFLFLAPPLLSQPRFENGYVVFQLYAPDAKSVVVAGDFNGWRTDDFLTKDETGIWSKKFKVKPGVYQYKFIVDGKWMLDPANPICFQLLLSLELCYHPQPN